MKRYLVTGATGYVGSMIVKDILLRDEEAEITVLVRNHQKAVSMLPSCVHVVTVDLTDRMAVATLQIECDAIFHCASVTKSAEMIAHPLQVTESIVNVTQNVMELARRCAADSVVYLSSMEVYGNVDCSDGHKVTEEQAGQGEVTLLSIRSCYPLAKRMAEYICYAYYQEYGVPIKIARLAQTFGKGVLPEDNRVFMQFARAVTEQHNIVLHTSGNSMGNYCGIEDALWGLQLILEKGVNGEAYNVVNEANTMTIRDMAVMVCDRIAHGKISVEYDISSEQHYGYAPDTGLRLSGEKLHALGFVPTQSMEEMYLDVIKEIML